MWDLLYGAGSILGQLLHIIYMSPLGKFLQSTWMQNHLYADDSHIYITFDIGNAVAVKNKIEEVESIICTWMDEKILCLNKYNTELILIVSSCHSW